MSHALANILAGYNHPSPEGYHGQQPKHSAAACHTTIHTRKHQPPTELQTSMTSSSTLMYSHTPTPLSVRNSQPHPHTLKPLAEPELQATRRARCNHNCHPIAEDVRVRMVMPHLHQPADRLCIYKRTSHNPTSMVLCSKLNTTRSAMYGLASATCPRIQRSGWRKPTRRNERMPTSTQQVSPRKAPI